MNQGSKTDRSRARRTGEPSAGSGSRGWLDARFPLTDMPTGLMLLLVAIGLPRTILADLDVVAPESGIVYYVLALAPFAVWLAVAILRVSRRPFPDFLVLGAVYAVSLIVVHLALWEADAGYGNRPPAGAVSFAERFGPGWNDVALRAHISGVALLIGVGSGVIVGLVAAGAGAWRTRRAS